MKGKLFILWTIIFLLDVSVFAQRNVSWAGISFADMTAETNSTQISPYFGGGALGFGSVGAAGGAATLGTGFYYELLVGQVWNGAAQAAPTTLAGFGAWTSSGLRATNSNTPGRLAVINPNAGATVSQLSTTVSNNIMLVGWSANLGTTFNQALANIQSYNWLEPAYFGVSQVGFIRGYTTDTTPGALVFGSVPASQGTPIYSLNTQLYLLAIPEPSTVSLTIFGAGALLLFRRKK